MFQAQEKKLEEDKSTQYYDDNSDYYDEDNYDEYRDSEDQDTPVQDTAGAKNRTRRDTASGFLLSGLSRMRRAVGAGASDRYNIIISQGPRRPAPKSDFFSIFFPLIDSIYVFLLPISII